MSVGLVLALVPAPLITADWTIDAATFVRPEPITIAMLADPAPLPDFTVGPPPDSTAHPVPDSTEPPPDATAQPAPVSIAQLPPPALAVPIDVVAKHHHAPDDPFETFNRSSYDFSMAVDKAILRPVALGYRHVVPRPARDGLHNLLSNIGEPLVFVNDLLQLKIGRAGKTLGRFVINSTLGFGGLLDTAKRRPFNLPHHNNSLGDTLGYYGVGPGPYLYLPILGPTTLRDAVAGQIEGLLLPRISRTPFGLREYMISTAVVGGLGQRADAEDDLRRILADSVDPYATMRSLVLQDRAGEIEGLKSGDIDDATKAPLAVPADPAIDLPDLDDPAAASPPKL